MQNQFQKHKTRKARKKRIGCGERCTLYGLAGPDGIIRYIGQTQNDPKTRLSWHRRSAKRSNSPVYDWLRNEPDVSIVVLNDNATWDVSEIIEIARRRANDAPLLNVTRGGRDTLDDCKREGCLPDWYGKHLKDQKRLATIANHPNLVAQYEAKGADW